MCKTFRGFKQVCLHAQCTSTLDFWRLYKKWWCIVNIMNVIIQWWCCTWTFVWWRFNEMNNKCWNNISENPILFLTPYIKGNLRQKIIFSHFLIENVQPCTPHFAYYGPFPIPPYRFVLPAWGFIKVMQVASNIDKEMNGVTIYIYIYI